MPVRWLVSTSPLVPDAQLPADTRLQDTRRGAQFVAATLKDAIGLWLGKVAVSGRGEGRAARIVRVWTLRRADIGRQIRLFPRVCECGTAFEVAAQGRIPKKCPDCRGKGRREFFRARAIARRVPA